MRRAERRSLERFPLEMPARFQCVQSPGEPDTDIVEMDGLTRDISSGGAFIKGGQPFQIGAEMNIQLMIPVNKSKALENVEDVRINVSGKITRIESGGFGVCFGDQYEIKPNA
jgi:c-di-GMP-binding flagellar brake protein YcgR